MPHIIKAEILWSRKCSLDCSYCAMVTNKNNTPSIETWQDGIYQLSQLGCSFLAFYGAEPLLEFEKLPQIIFYSKLLGMDSTVITNGVVPDLVNKLKTLYDFGLRSISTSFDITENMGTDSVIKSRRALNVIDIFRSFGEVDNVAVITTLTNKNFKKLPQTIKEMSDKKIWTFFDLIHFDRKQPGTKVKNSGINLLFTKDDFKALIDVLYEVKELKNHGYLCHASEIFLNKIIAEQNNIYTWNCSKEKSFPAWVTVDCNGEVYPCDDFHMKAPTKYDVWNIYDKWEEFCASQKAAVANHCPGCCWNTHIDACAIKEEKLPLTDYIHK